MRETWKILYLMELKSNNIIANWCPNTALQCCLTTLSQNSGWSVSMCWNGTTRQITQRTIRMSLCRYFSDLCEFVQMFSSPNDAASCQESCFFLLATALACNSNQDIPKKTTKGSPKYLQKAKAFCALSIPGNCVSKIIEIPKSYE